MLVFPNAKINLGLNILEKRSDGYHNIESCFYPVPWKDALEVIKSDNLHFTTSGIPIPGESNICLTAYHLLKEEYDIPAVNIHLHKNIPIGAGLGGGSADGAFMLKLLNNKFSLNISDSKLRAFAGELGSDCPFFIDNKPAFIEGTGNIISTIDLSLEGLYIAIIYPNILLDTQLAYSGIVPSKPHNRLKQQLENHPAQNWSGEVNNAFEKNADSRILELKESLYTSGAIYASMTGSGSAVYGLFKETPDLSIDYPNIIAKF